ncbi:signal peptidase II [Pikeienuella sp. HZG-20]|uniref:signal peptidase II n=1 Tax=Paludibacillus litoralis TaxID=3133267 RepID=UPI0030EC8144
MRVIAVFAALAFALDQGAKLLVMYGLNLVDRGAIDIAPPFLRFVMAWNRGINFGVFASHAELARWSLVGLSLAISVALLIWARRKDGFWLHVGAGLVIGGALGNALDRIRYGAVADFLNMSCCGLNNPYVFNIADAAIFAGAGLMILTSGEKKRSVGH